MGFIRQRRDAGEKLPGEWVIDAEGRATDDPNVVFAEPKGALLPLGGLDAGYKGFGLALMIEALSQGLAGHGRKDAPRRWGGNVYLQLIDPGFFAGADAFAEQTGHLAERCRANRPVDPHRPVRLPGDQAAAGIERAMREGLAVDAPTRSALNDWAARLGVASPLA